MSEPKRGTGSRARVVVLGAPGARPWPGLEPLELEAELVRVHDDAELGRALEQADILVVTDIRTEALPRAWRRSSPTLRWIHATSAGVDAIVFPELAQAGVVLTNARGLFDHAIAESVIGTVMAFAKDLRRTFELQDQRTWRHRETGAVRGQRLLVVGAGSIGRQIARYARGVGLVPSGVARIARDDPELGRVHTAGELDELLPRADWVVIAAPLTSETRGLIDRRALSRMKPSARLVNVGRGPIVNTDDLVRALKRGEIAGAALDVFEEEPLPSDHPLWAMPQVIITAHMAGDFVGWREALSVQFIDLFRAYRRGEPLWNRVDMQNLLS